MKNPPNKVPISCPTQPQKIFFPIVISEILIRPMTIDQCAVQIVIRIYIYYAMRIGNKWCCYLAGYTIFVLHFVCFVLLFGRLYYFCTTFCLFLRYQYLSTPKGILGQSTENCYYLRTVYLCKVSCLPYKCIA